MFQGMRYMICDQYNYINCHKNNRAVISYTLDINNIHVEFGQYRSDFSININKNTKKITSVYFNRSLNPRCNINCCMGITWYYNRLIMSIHCCIDGRYADALRSSC